MKKQNLKLITALCLVMHLGFAQIISTVAGNGTTGFSGDGGAATSAQLYANPGVAVDNTGNIYIADWGNHVIRKVSGGIISTIAGTAGSPGYSGDGGPATQALLKEPQNICVDANYNVYFTEHGNHTVRKIDNAGTISTIAGIGGQWCNGMSHCGDGGPATSALLKSPHGIAVNAAGDIFIGDEGNYAVRKIDHSTQIITTIAGDQWHYYPGCTGDGGQATSALITVSGLALDAAGNIFICSDINHSIRKISTTGVISRFAGIYNSAGNAGDGGSALSATFFNPQGVGVDASGNVYVSDQYNNRTRVINTSGVINAFAGTGAYGYSGDGGPATSAVLQDPEQIAFDNCGNVFIADWGSSAVRKVMNGTPANFGAAITSATPVCSGSNIVANCSFSGSSDFYTWHLQSCDQYGNITSAYNGPIIWGGGNPPSPYTFANTANIPCNQWYKITLTLSKNCPVQVSQTVTKLIYVNCKPSVTISGNTNICNGSSTTLCLNPSPAGSYNYNWAANSLHYISQCITVSPTANTTYNGTIVNPSTGCQASASVLVKVAVNNPSFNLADITTTCNYAKIYALANNAVTTSNPGYKYMYVLEELTSNLSSTVWTENNNPCYWWNFPASATYFNGIVNTPNDYTTSNVALSTACGSFVPGSSHTTAPFADGQFAYGKPYRITLGSWIVDPANNNATVCPWAQSSQIIIPGCGTMRESSSTFDDRHAPDFSYLMNQASTADVKTNSAESKNVLIYPNPSKGSFRVETGIEAAQQLELFDINGRVVLSRVVEGSAEIDAVHLSEGVYNLKLSNGEQVANKRLVIAK